MFQDTLLIANNTLQADLYAGALFITEATKIKGDYAIYIAILILLAIACIFTVAGGLTAVIWTDFVQTILMIIGALAVCVKCK
jgi:sodium/glucose cotransporter 1/sodium/glucose cotransporter 9